jgi:hypothetical protein
MKIDEIKEKYGIDPTSVPETTYMINDKSNMLSVATKSRINPFEIPAKHEVYGSFSDLYYYYFSPLKENENE